MSISGEIIGGVKGIFSIIFLVGKWGLILAILIVSIIAIVWAIKNVMNHLEEKKALQEHKKRMEAIETNGLQ